RALPRILPHPFDGEGVDGAAAACRLPGPVGLQAVRAVAARIKEETIAWAFLQQQTLFARGIKERLRSGCDQRQRATVCGINLHYAPSRMTAICSDNMPPEPLQKARSQRAI